MSEVRSLAKASTSRSAAAPFGRAEALAKAEALEPINPTRLREAEASLRWRQETGCENPLLCTRATASALDWVRKM